MKKSTAGVHSPSGSSVQNEPQSSQQSHTVNPPPHNRSRINPSSNPLNRIGSSASQQSSGYSSSRTPHTGGMSSHQIGSPRMRSHVPGTPRFESHGTVSHGTVSHGTGSNGTPSQRHSQNVSTSNVHLIYRYILLATSSFLVFCGILKTHVIGCPVWTSSIIFLGSLIFTHDIHHMSSIPDNCQFNL